MAIPSEAQNIFLKLAEMFGKKTVPFEDIKGKSTVPASYIGSWVLLERSSDGWLSIAEIASTKVTLRDLKFPLGAIAFRPADFPQAVDMAMYAIREYMYVYPAGIKREIPPGEILGAALPLVTIDGTTYYRDDVKREFRVKGHPEQRISFEEYEKKYFNEYRQLRAYFSGNVIKMQGSSGSGAKSYETTSQDNALQTIAYWVHNGVLEQRGTAPEVAKRPGRGEGNWLDIVKAKGTFYIADNHNQELHTVDAPKALRALRNWVYGGLLSG